MCKSTVDWCEQNYNVVEYIAEFWNTITGVAIAISALYFRRLATREMKRIVWYLLLVSVGTILFHSTLLYKYQLLDEMPMLLIAMEYLRILANLEIMNLVKTAKKWVIILLEMRYVFIIVIPFTYVFGPHVQIVSFHATLKMYECTILYVMYIMSKSFNNVVFSKVYGRSNELMSSYTAAELRKNNRKSQVHLIGVYLGYRKEMSYHIKIGIGFYVGSMLLWAIENGFCKNVEFLQFHAWWHVLSSIGIYHLNNIIRYYILIDQIDKKIS
jgi:hypothetical protein